MMGGASRSGNPLSGKVLLGILVVAAATGGFTLGYYVGRSVPSPSASSLVKQQTSEGESPLPALPAPVATPNPAAEGSSAAIPAVQSVSPEKKHPDIAPSGPEKSPLKAEAKHEGKSGSSSVQTPSVTEAKTSSAEKALPGQMAVSQTAGPGDQGAATSSPSENARDVSGSAALPSGKVMYTVQAGAFRNQKDAEALKRKLESKKYKASIKKETGTKGMVYFKVRTGEFESKKEASVFALKLKKTEGLNAFATTRK